MGHEGVGVGLIARAGAGRAHLSGRQFDVRVFNLLLELIDMRADLVDLGRLVRARQTLADVVQLLGVLGLEVGESFVEGVDCGVDFDGHGWPFRVLIRVCSALASAVGAAESLRLR